mmetsp:Transcript_25491/g.47777  ORF Transcript_25491/g.47777 Transcript_25491/m.47777 type:complete len:81 (+) Transcript_25491:5481-5723(+)
MDIFENFHTRFLDVTETKIGFLQNRHSYGLQRFRRPVCEPINGTAINKSGKVTQSISEHFSKWRHTDTKVDIFSHTCNVL